MAKITILELHSSDRFTDLFDRQMEKVKGGSTADPSLPFYDSTQRFPYCNPKLKDL